MGLLLDYDCAVANLIPGYHFSDLYQITPAQLTIDREVEQSLVA